MSTLAPGLNYAPAPCPKCGARTVKEAETACQQTSDETGEFSCPGDRDDGVNLLQPTAASLKALDDWCDAEAAREGWLGAPQTPAMDEMSTADAIAQWTEILHFVDDNMPAELPEGVGDPIFPPMRYVTVLVTASDAAALRALLAAASGGWRPTHRVDENHPMLAAILAIRHRRVTDDIRDFTTPSEKRGIKFSAADDAILECYRAVEAALKTLPSDA